MEDITRDLKEQGDVYIKNKEYEKAINIYSNLLACDMDNYKLLSNRSVAYIKTEQYDKALEDAIKCTRLKPGSSKYWGRLGASLYGLNNNKDALISYMKAYELEPLPIYKEMIDTIDDSSNNENIFSNLIDNILSPSFLTNPLLLNKLTNINFQNKLLMLQNNPLDAFKDNDIMEIMNIMMKKVTL